MPWMLVKIADESSKIILITGQDIIVGRKGAAINLPDDLSISRMHAIIRVEASNRLPTITIKDTSKYGTTVNGLRLESGGANTLLNNNDTIQFGIFENIWRVVYNPFICTTSGLSKSERRSVAQSVIRLGGSIVNEWNEDCTHLIMTNIFMTVKVINALVSQCSIILPSYLDYMIAHKSWPLDPKEYEPPKEKTTFYADDAKFCPDSRRLSILKDMTFYVLTSKQESKIKYAVQKCSGKVILINPNSVRENQVKDDSNCFVEPPKELPKTSVMRLIALLKKFDKRFVSEGEISLAILFCSTGVYCNPKTSEGVIVQGSLPETQFSSSFSQRDETQSTLIEKIGDDLNQTQTMDIDEPRVTNINELAKETESDTSEIQDAQIEEIVIDDEIEDLKVEDLNMVNFNREKRKIEASQTEVLETKINLNQVVQHEGTNHTANTTFSSKFISLRSSHCKNNEENLSLIKIKFLPIVQTTVAQVSMPETPKRLRTSTKTFVKVQPKTVSYLVPFQGKKNNVKI